MNDVNKNLGHATAYGYAKSKGYTGTEEEFAELMADYAEVGERAEAAETAAAAWRLQRDFLISLLWNQSPGSFL